MSVRMAQKNQNSNFNFAKFKTGQTWANQSCRKCAKKKENKSMKKSLNTKQNGFLKISIIQKAQKWTETAKINKKID